MILLSFKYILDFSDCVKHKFLSLFLLFYFQGSIEYLFILIIFLMLVINNVINIIHYNLGYRTRQQRQQPIPCQLVSIIISSTRTDSTTFIVRNVCRRMQFCGILIVTYVKHKFLSLFLLFYFQGSIGYLFILIIFLMLVINNVINIIHYNLGFRTRQQRQQPIPCYPDSTLLRNLHVPFPAEHL